MSMRTIPTNQTNFDPEIRPSAEYTAAIYQLSTKYPANIGVRNTCKRGIPMSYWTCICISGVGIYDADVRAMPGIDEEAADRHARAFDPGVQRSVALELIHAAFPSQAALLQWLQAQAADQMHGSAVLLHRYTPLVHSPSPAAGAAA